MGEGMMMNMMNLNWLFVRLKLIIVMIWFVIGIKTILIFSNSIQLPEQSSNISYENHFGIQF